MMDKKGHKDTVNLLTYKCMINHDGIRNFNQCTHKPLFKPGAFFHETECKNYGVMFSALSNLPANEHFIDVSRRNLACTCHNYGYG
eukprot:5452773-Ditylum_brightwellii.AAC.1